MLLLDVPNKCQLVIFIHSTITILDTDSMIVVYCF